MFLLQKSLIQSCSAYELIFANKFSIPMTVHLSSYYKIFPSCGQLYFFYSPNLSILWQLELSTTRATSISIWKAVGRLFPCPLLAVSRSSRYSYEDLLLLLIFYVLEHRSRDRLKFRTLSSSASCSINIPCLRATTFPSSATFPSGQLVLDRRIIIFHFVWWKFVLIRFLFHSSGK